MLQTARLPPCHCQCLLSSSHWHVFLDTGTAPAQQMACSVCPQLGFQGCVKALYKEVLFALRLQLNVPQHVKGIYQLHYTMHQNLKQGSEIFLTDLSNFGQGAKTLLWKPSFHLELFQCLTFRVFSFLRPVHRSATTSHLHAQAQGAGGCRNQFLCEFKTRKNYYRDSPQWHMRCRDVLPPRVTPCWKGGSCSAELWPWVKGALSTLPQVGVGLGRILVRKPVSMDVNSNTARRKFINKVLQQCFQLIFKLLVKVESKGLTGWGRAPDHLKQENTSIPWQLLSGCSWSACLLKNHLTTRVS